MKLADINMIHLFWALAGLMLFYILALKKRRRDMERFAEKGLIDKLTPGLKPGGERLRAILIAVSLIMIILSLIRPQWGFEWREVKRSGLDIMIAIDTSKSMLAEDVKPNRLERSKLAVKDLVKKLHGDRMGLIAFSGSAFLQCPLTVDYSGFMLSLDNLDVKTIPKGGTSITSAIGKTLQSFEGGIKKYKVLVIITDGEDHEGSYMDMADAAAKEGIKIFTIGIGSEEGELIPVIDNTGRKAFLKDREGNVVKTRLDETALKEIALTTGGSYVKATQREFGLDLIYDKKLSKMEKRETENRMIKRYEERFQIPLAVALLLLLIEPFISRKKKLKVEN